MEENKCCENCHCGKCATWIVIVGLILLVIAFYIGTVVGPLNFKLKNDVNKQQNTQSSSTGSITVNVIPPTTDTTTNNPPVLE